MDVSEIFVSGALVKLVAAIAILLVGFLIGRFVGKLFQKILHQLNTNKILKESAKIKAPVEEFFGSLVKYIIYFAAIIMALNQLGLTTTVLYIILIILLIILVVIIILALKDFIPNVIAGLFIYQKRNLKKGDKIRFKNTEGRIESINLVETKIKTESGDIIFVPNSVLTKNEVIKLKK